MFGTVPAILIETRFNQHCHGIMIKMIIVQPHIRMALRLDLTS